MSDFFTCPTFYIESATTLKAKIEKIDTLITALEDAAIRAAAGEEIKEYLLDDGQTRIRSIARSAEEISRSIIGWESVKQIYVNRLNSRVSRAVDQFSNSYL